MKAGVPYTHIVSVDTMSNDWIRKVLDLTKTLKASHKKESNANGWVMNFASLLERHVMVALFYEASTRTRLSFEAAMLQLGGQVIGTEAAGMFSSATKGETLADTIKVTACYGHVIVLRHPQKGSAQEAADQNICPIINAGDGDGEHPTQALLDLFTIVEQFGWEKSLAVTLVGDLKHGRTVHSLIKLVIKMGIAFKFNLVAPEGLELPPEYLQAMEKNHIPFFASNVLTPEIIANSDVVYMTRVQKERMKEGTTAAGDAYALTLKLAGHLVQDAIIMHPLPRNAELPQEIDALPQAKYFHQAENGLYVRMALLLHVFGK